jgi:uncharacterized protein YukE
VANVAPSQRIAASTEELERAAGGVRNASYEVDGVAADLLSALATLDRALGDPHLTTALGGLADAWRGAARELATSLHVASVALEQGATAYADAEHALRRAGETAP